MWTWSNVCLDFTLFPREVYVLTWEKSGKKTTSFFSSISNQIQILPVQGLLEDNDKRLAAFCRCGFKIATCFVFPDLKYLNTLCGPTSWELRALSLLPRQ